MSSRATIDPGRTRSGSSRGDTGLSPITPGGIRRLTCRTIKDAYSQERSVEDLKGLLDHLGIECAHIGGLSMGGSVALHFGIGYPRMARSLIVAGAGTGSVDPDAFRRTANELADQMETQGMQAMSDYAKGPVRVQLMSKDPVGWERFNSQFLSHSSVGSSRTFRGFQARRAPIFDLEPQLRALNVPTLSHVRRRGRPMHRAGSVHEEMYPRVGDGRVPESRGTPSTWRSRTCSTALSADFLSAVDIDSWPERLEGVDTGRLA